MTQKKTSPSKRWHFNEVDLQKWGKNTALFFAPALLLALMTYQSTGDFDKAWVAIQVWMLNTLIDLTRKFIATNQ